MVEKTFCDRCNKEISSNDFFDNVFEKMGFGDMSQTSEISVNGKKTKLPKRINKVQLCKNCLIGYDKIIDKANKKISDYIKEGKK